MTPFIVISSLILFGLSGLCFWLPSRNGKKGFGLIISLSLGITIVWTLIWHLDFLVIFVWPLLFAFQFVFLIYWTLRSFKWPKTATLFTLVLTTILLLFAMQPWISDWIFSKNDVKKILHWHNIELKDDFKILKNESGGFRDYAHSFKLEISQSDYDRIADIMRSSNNYLGLITNLSGQLPHADYKSTDTINYETKNHIEREYYTDKKKEDGTFHFFIQLSKKERELNYFGINE